MKRILFIALACLMAVMSVFACMAEGAQEQYVYVTISSEGAQVLSCVQVPWKDANEDGAITIADALILAHDAHFEGGAQAGFVMADSGYGNGLTKLWGVENGGSYGYYVNNISAMNLDEPLEAESSIVAYSYADLTAWSDAYTCFDQSLIEIDTTNMGGCRFSEFEYITLTLSAMGWDENFAPVSTPVANAVILVNGEPATITTPDGEVLPVISNEDGTFEVVLRAPGEYVISAQCDLEYYVAPVCCVSIAG